MAKTVSEKENSSPKVVPADANIEKAGDAQKVATKRTKRGEEPEYGLKDLDEALKKERQAKKLAGAVAKPFTPFTFTEEKLNDPDLPESALIRTRDYQLLIEGLKSLVVNAKAELVCDVAEEPSKEMPLYIMSKDIAELVPFETLGPKLVPAVFDDESDDEEEDSEDESDGEPEDLEDKSENKAEDSEEGSKDEARDSKDKPEDEE